jgi:hypothetical protein
VLRVTNVIWMLELGRSVLSVPGIEKKGLLSLHFDTSNALYYLLSEPILPISCVSNSLFPP